MKLTLGDVLSKIQIKNKRIPDSRSDFGDLATVSLKLRRMGKSLASYGDYDFGHYLGCVEGKFHVGTHKIMEFHPSKLETFDSLSDLKQQWELD